MDLKTMAKAAGLSEGELRGKSLDEQIKLITKKMKEEKETLELESAKEYLDNLKTQVPKLKEFLDQPFEIYVKKVGQRKSPTTVQVVGYNPNEKTLIVLNSDKLYQIEDGDLIKSMDDLMNSKETKKRTGTVSKKKK
jgi:hypothetical protein